MFTRVVRKNEHNRRFTVIQNGRCWEVVEEQDHHVVRRVLYDDWHRVERARRVFALEADYLCKAGWVSSQA
jgi:hypothetical protein